MDPKAQKILASGVAIAIVILTLALLYNRIVKAPVEAATDVGHKVVQSCKDLLNTTPIVTVNERIIVHTPTGIAELATASQDLSIDYKFEDTWLHSTKWMSLRGTFKAKAGFNVGTNFNVRITTRPLTVTVEMPAPEVLSCELIQHDVVDSAGGWWNSLTPYDQKEAVNAMIAKAHFEVQKGGILESAKHEFENKFKAMPQLHDVPLTFIYGKAMLR